MEMVNRPRSPIHQLLGPIHDPRTEMRIRMQGRSDTGVVWSSESALSSIIRNLLLPPGQHGFCPMHVA